jgi:hypothetical protein
MSCPHAFDGHPGLRIPCSGFPITTFGNDGLHLLLSILCVEVKRKKRIKSFHERITHIRILINGNNINYTAKKIILWIT